MSENKSLAEVELCIPSRPEYVGVARLAILGVASRMRFSYDDVEDIRLAVGEACTRSIDKLNDEESPHPIRLRCLVEPNRLTVEARTPAIPAPEAEPAGSVDSMSASELGGVLIRILMDEVEIIDDEASGQQILRMIKYVAR